MSKRSSLYSVKTYLVRVESALPCFRHVMYIANDFRQKQFGVEHLICGRNHATGHSQDGREHSEVE